MRRRATLVLERVTKTYAAGDIAVQALRGVDVRVERGEFVAAIGASGSELMEIFRRRDLAGRTIVMITYESHVAAYARRVVHIADGLIQADEASAAVLTA